MVENRRTALGCYREALERASICRIQVSKAARLGMPLLAMQLIARGHQCDRVAEDWRSRIPQWQWNGEREGNEHGTAILPGMR